MQQECIVNFLGKHVRLTRNDGFVLIGTIDKVYENEILFTTHQATSAIPIDTVREVLVYMNGKTRC